MTQPSLRQQLAQECARLMVEECLDNYRTAKRKAAEKLGIPLRYLPSNSEIEQAIQDYRRLFFTRETQSYLQQKRQAALQAMRLCAAFNPRLVGAVLTGAAHEHSEINLHLFADSAEEVAFLLIEKGIPFHLKERAYNGIQKTYPCYCFQAGNESITLVVFPTDGIRLAPPSSIDGKPMRRADLQTVEALLVDV